MNNQPRDLDMSDVHADAAKMYQKYVDDLIAALDQFSPRDAVSYFFEWLAEQPGAHQGSGTTEGYEEYFVNPEERDQSLLYITLNGG